MYYSISVVVVAYNEEETIKSTIDKLLPVVKKNFSDYEVIIVESGSTDRTAVIADTIAKKDKKIRVIHQGKRLGYGNAVRTGLKECKKDLSIYTDCDMPYDFKYLVKASRYIGRYDGVIGYTVGKRESIGRLMLSAGARVFTRLFFGLNVKAVTFPFKMVRTSVLRRFKLVSNSNFAPVEILLELKKCKVKIKQIEIPYIMRKEGKSKVTNYLDIAMEFLLDAFNYFKKNIKI